MKFKPGDLVRLGEYNSYENKEIYHNLRNEYFQVMKCDPSDNTIYVYDDWYNVNDVEYVDDQTKIPFDNVYYDRNGNRINRKTYLKMLTN